MTRSLELILEAAERLGAGAPRDALRCAEEALRHAPRDPDALYFAGAAHYRCGELGSAESRLKQAIQADGRTAAFHGTLGNVLQDRGALNEAIAQYRRAIRLKPDCAEAHNDLGTAYFARGDEARALECYARAAQLQPSHAVAYSNLGAVYRKLGLAREARRALQRELWLRIWSFFQFKKKNLAQAQLDRGNPRLAARIAQLEPRNARTLAILGAARRELGEIPEAIAATQEAVALSPSDARLKEQLERLLADRYLAQRDWQKLEKSPLPFHRGEALFKLGRTQEAETALREAVAADRRDLRAWIRLGDLLRLGGRLDEAEACLERAVALDEESPAALVALGLLARDKGRTKAAIERFEQALRLDAQNALAMQQMGEILRYENRIEEAERRFREGLKARPGDLRLLTDLAMVLGDQMRYSEAFACIEQVLALDAASPLAMAAKGVLLDLTGREAEAEKLLRAALQTSAGDIDLGYNLAICQLRHGKFAEGWAGFELRRQKETFIGRYRKFPFPEWQGEPLAGKTLLVYPEQGLGDEIMFGSCLPQAIEQAGRVAIECNPKLGALFTRSFPRCSVMPRQRTMANDWVNHLQPRPDYQVPIGSLAGHFRQSAEDFPQHGGFLNADSQKIDQWKARLAALGPGPKIGLSWQGGVGHTGRARRSLSLEQLLPLLRLPGAQFVSLQYTEVQDEIDELARRHGIRVHHWQAAIDDYDETAALVCALDKVLTVCTAIVHLTGALGRPALVMVPFGSDWRYGAQGERMLWYPSVRLLRQREIGKWADVLESVKKNLI